MTDEKSPSPLPAHRALTEIWATPAGWRSLTAVNHSIVGKRFLATAAAFFAIGGLLAMLMRAQLATSDNAFLGHEAYNQIFTMHGTVMMFLFAIPMIEGLALYLLPKMLGARDLSFPRLSAFGYFCYLFGGVILLTSMVLGLAPNSGWFLYTPLSSRPFAPGINSDVWLIGVTFVEVSAIAIGVELVVTILTVRTAGMSLARMPLFAWYILVTAFMILFGFPPLILGSIILELERAFGWPFFDAGRGGHSLLWQHLFWLFGHPEVYIIFLPGAAIVSTLIAVFARRPIVGYTWVVAAVIAMGFISFGLWVHHMYTVGIPHLALAFFSAASMLVAIPTAVQFFAWIATLWAGRPYVRLPMLYLFGFLVVFVAGGLTGVMLALVPFDWQVHDTHFVVAHMHYVLIGGFVFPLLAGAYYWLPHITGRMPSETLGRLAFWLIFVGFNLTFLVMHLTGLLGMPRRVYVYPAEMGWDWPNLVSSIGGFVLSIGFALVLVDLFLHKRLGPHAPRNPWGAATLDWAMATPPPAYNFASLPQVAGRDPLWDNPGLPDEMAAGEHYLAEARNEWQETLGVDPVTGRPAFVILLPRPTWLPLVAAGTLAVFFVGFLLSLYTVAALGAAASLAAFLRWAWASGLKADPDPVPAGRGLDLPLHPVVRNAPGYLGVVFTLVADGTLLASLLFGYFFLWAVAPGWPPDSFVRVPFVITILALGGALGGYLAARAAASANGRAGTAATLGWLALSGGLGLVGTAGFLALPVLGYVLPATHAYDATVTALTGYGAFHCAVGAVIAGHALMRCSAGFVSARRDLDLRVLRAWWAYTAGSGLAVWAAILAFPAVLGGPGA